MNIIEKHSNKFSLKKKIINKEIKYFFFKKKRKFILTLFIIVTLVQLITCFNYSFEKIKHTHQFTGY